MRDDTDLTEHDADRPGAPDAVRHERILELPAGAAWELLGSREGLETWLGDEVDLEVQPGAEGTIRDGDERLLTEIESIDPGRRVSLRWWSEERGAAVVDLTIEPVSDEATRLVVTEIPVRALRVPAAPGLMPRRHPGGTSGPQLRAAGSSALALA